MYGHNNEHYHYLRGQGCSCRLGQAGNCSGRSPVTSGELADSAAACGDHQPSRHAERNYAKQSKYRSCADSKQLQKIEKNKTKVHGSIVQPSETPGQITPVLMLTPPPVTSVRENRRECGRWQGSISWSPAAFMAGPNKLTQRFIIVPFQAGMAELADAADSKSAGT